MNTCRIYWNGPREDCFIHFLVNVLRYPVVVTCPGYSLNPQWHLSPEQTHKHIRFTKPATHISINYLFVLTHMFAKSCATVAKIIRCRFNYLLVRTCRKRFVPMYKIYYKGVIVLIGIFERLVFVRILSFDGSVFARADLPYHVYYDRILF